MVSSLVKHAKLEDKKSRPFKDFINHRNRDDVNALFYAAERSYWSVFNLLLDEGIDLWVANNTGTTALHAASLGGNTDMVLARHEDFKKFLDYPNHEAKTALINAAWTGRIEIAKELVKHNADYLAVENDDCSTLNLSCWESRTEMVAFLLEVASTKLSRERFVTFLNHRNKWGKTAFVDAAIRGRLHIVEMLREQQYGANYQLADDEDVTTLHHSSRNGHKEVVAFVLKTASEDSTSVGFRNFVDHRNKRGTTALIDAAENNRADVIHLPLDYEADYSIGDHADLTALHYAAFRNQMAAVCALLERTSQDKSDKGTKFKRFLNQQSKNNRATALRDAAI